ncbi:hypothetical protein [Mycolicibacterium fortuitum]|uniref:Uncharacterized protein n=2 Tax=Mycolicibacterium fortuitum TaxID=1766 RepID=A0AAE4VFQ0_MYCFO|nr:hypothetical protein [Mycolicibacterium fortuitum]MCV7137898.1 hypothetical protein [Mycolicibacterium fortuitum]MDV7195390.1 hypothetical protein [Mycolicibacterium fortuitum]MDV7207914.1 hypothetical protein [Mycolicibacterium fortuitum]MDV7229212.1 hypothetical protein [Mycolicibacterium fortuitum]MDV7260911.1 hypothetical protein [Mycolicibacterium fortuitum]
MIQVLHASHNGVLYKRHIANIDDIADLIRESDVETLTSADGRTDFWITPSTRPANRRINRKATEIFLATTGFTAKNVPLLRGIVVLTAHGTTGAPVTMTDAHLTGLADTVGTASWRDALILAVRYARDERRQRRAEQAVQPDFFQRKTPLRRLLRR